VSARCSFCSWLLSVETTYALNFVFVKVWDHADDDPGQAAAEVDGLVHDEAHDTGSERIVADVCVPRSPHALEVVEMDIVLGHLVEVVPVGVCGVREHGIGDGIVRDIVAKAAVSVWSTNGAVVLLGGECC
jgi:hypothetical protein